MLIFKSLFASIYTVFSFVQWSENAVYNREEEEEEGEEERPVLAEAPPTSWGNHGKRRLRHNGRNAVYKYQRVCRGDSRARIHAVGCDTCRRK